jgi:arabinose-5-phosphate isomerase
MAQSPLSEVINTISRGRLGLALVNEGDKTTGIITDGDLRRLMEAQGKNAWDMKAADFMTHNPKTIALGTSLHEAEELLKQLKIASLIVVDTEGLTVGVVQIYDLH